MKSFNEWMKSRLNEEQKDYTGWFLGRKLLCVKCGNTWENKDPHLNLYSYMSSGPPPLQFANGEEYHPEEEAKCPKCHAKSDGEGNVIRWHPNDNWQEPEGLDPGNHYGPGGDPFYDDSIDMDYHDRDEFRRPEY